VKEMRKILEQEKFEVWEKELSAQFIPDPEEIKNAIQFGREFVKKLKVN